MDVALANAAHCIGEPRAALSREQQVNGVVHLHEGEGMQAVPEARRGQAAKTMPALIVENDDTLVNAELGDEQARRAGSDNACACKNRPFGGSRYADSALRGLNPVRAAMVADPADYRG